MATSTGFTKGGKVKFKMVTRNGTKTGKGTIKTLPPKNPSRGNGRMTVIDADGNAHKPFPSQCSGIA